MEKHDTVDGLLDILREKMGVDENLLTEEYYDNQLTGMIFRFTALDMICLFLEVEKKFKCSINSNGIQNYEFNSILGIANVVMKSKSSKIDLK